MPCYPPFARKAGAVFSTSNGSTPIVNFVLLLAALAFVYPALARAQSSPSTVIARVSGVDVSVENGTQDAPQPAEFTSNIPVLNGSVVTVHSGHAQMTLSSGGRIDICGPAKLTMLQAGGSITLALDFGRLHAELPASTSFRVFTPTINATPLDVSGGARDVTIGLYLNDSLCVRATSGALLLEHQFSGDKMVVPQNGEFFLDSGKLAPVAGTPGSCQCTAAQTQVLESESPEGALGQTSPQAPPQAPPPIASRTVPAETQSMPPADYRGEILSHGNETHPISPAARSPAPEAPAISSSDAEVRLPPLVFSATSPDAPHDPTADIVLLVRTARVQPEWDFTGRVEAPDFAAALQQRLGEASRTSQNPAQTTDVRSTSKGKKSGGFWARLKRVFAGSAPDNNPKPCEGVGCG